MMGSKSISNAGLCWADEVEKEEEEETRAHLNQQKKLNPFGSARPREVVLQEKGIDWRNLDQKLHEPSNQRKENQSMEKIPAPTEQVGGKQPWSPRTRGQERNMKSARVVRRESGSPSGCLTFQNQNCDPLVPPLRYPPKNVMVLMKEDQWPSNGYKVEDGLPNSKRLRGNTIHELGLQRPLSSKTVDNRFQDPHFHRHPDTRDRNIKWDKENQILEEERRRFTKEDLGHRAMEEMRSVRSSSIHREREWESMGSKYNGRDVVGNRSRGPLLVNGRRGVFDGHFNWEGMEIEYGRMDGFGERIRRASPINALPSERRREHYHLDDGRAGFDGNYKNVGVRPVRPSVVEEPEIENMEYLYGRQKFVPKEFEGPRTKRVDGGRADDHQNLDKEGEWMALGFSRNDKKRGLKSVSNNSHDHQRRRR